MSDQMRLSRKGNKRAGVTNRTKGSGVEVIVRTDDTGEWVKPATMEKFFIDEDAVFPNIEFEFRTEVPGPYQWEWIMNWTAKVSGLREKVRGKELRKYEKTGKFTQGGKTWNALSIGMVIGGTLRVVVQVGHQKFVRTIEVLARQPGKERVLTLLRKNEESVMGKIMEQESQFKHVLDRDLEPIVSGDRGFGIGQLTIEPPTYEQIWSWKMNVEESISRFRKKRAIAKAYLGSQGRTYTQDMLDLETIARWNGGKYYEWNDSSKQWERQRSILCDTRTGNIGWDMENDANAGKTEEELRERDKNSYNKMGGGQNAEHPWKYSGVCYADHIVKN